MFSMMPKIFTPVFLQKVISRLTSPVDTACSQRKKRCYNVICLFLLRVVVVQSCGHLRRGYQDGSIDTAVFFHVFQHCQMFIRRPGWCVHQQHIQFPPCNI